MEKLTEIKWNVIFVTVLLFISLSYSWASVDMVKGSSASADSALSAGNRHYINHEFDKAVQSYTKAADLGYESDVLYYNIGNAYYKQDKLAKAILYYEKALLINPGDEDIRQNLTITNARIVDKINKMPVFLLKRWVTVISNFLNPDQWAVLSLILFFIALTGFSFYIISHRYHIRKIGFSLGVVLLIVAITGFIFMQGRMHSMLQKNSAIIMMSPVNAKSSPDEQSTNVFVLHEGTKVTLIDSIQNWKEIKIADGNKGWIPGDVLEEI